MDSLSVMSSPPGRWPDGDTVLREMQVAWPQLRSVEDELPTGLVRRFLVPTERGDLSLTWFERAEPWFSVDLHADRSDVGEFLAWVRDRLGSPVLRSWQSTDEPELRVLGTQADVERYLDEVYG